jgi:DNA-binding response OmpR family regulator
MSGVSIRVLVIEDDEDAALLLSLQLNEACPESCLFSIDCAGTLTEGLKRLQTATYDIILLDLGLPDSHGLESVDRIKAVTATPIIVLTGLQDRGIGVEAVSRGAQDFLCKSDADTGTLRRAMSFAIGRSKGTVAPEPAADPDWSALAHELRSPISIVMAAVANMREGLTGPLTEDQKQMVQLAERNIGRINRALENILGLARLQSSRPLVKSEGILLLPLLREVTEGAQILAQRAARVTLETELPPNLPLVRGDSELTVQVLTNLIDNALRHGAARVLVKAEANGNEAIVSVLDDGPGVAADKLHTLFQRFTQLERSGAIKGYRGTGLGLALCRESARLQNGRVWAEPGPGGKFYFALPLCKAAAVAAPAPEASMGGTP